MKPIFIGWKPEPFANYVNALHLAGADVERDDPTRCGALLLPGGGDMHPRFYGQDLRGSREIDEARDETELALLRRFLDAGRPVLGICRGMQLINVALGGTLHQHIEGHSRQNGVDRVHATRTGDSRLRELYGPAFAVNSSHHQAVDRLGCGLRAVQWAEDGTIEAIWHETLPVFAVQWHPERMCGRLARPDTVDGMALLSYFVRLSERHAD